ncbi:MAG: glutamine-hydrolyzing carbamoyl-phosphate synthase small subunit [Deltaproteobacteria bacterium]|nr:glutamine-hydrolyzing carbamoyl-phosphate synthase small subunit [Candidatus Anaeroferrophillus wilburensis]MBN2889891.1 glutamine-hydrolyzing carbamoyl-phosphate synthase small subunit [Deltaproteobacteria bacterium]
MAFSATKAVLVLADGTTFSGRSFGAAGEAIGEVVFNTSLTGYQEVLTDPSYRGQMVTMTYPQIGNYGVNAEDVESRKLFLSGFIVKEYCRYPSNWRQNATLGRYLEQAGVVGIEGIDTRFLTRRIRLAGAMPGIISTVDDDQQSLLRKLSSWAGIEGVNLVDGASCSSKYEWHQGQWTIAGGYQQSNEAAAFHVVAYDFGIKYNILRLLVNAGCKVTVVPADTSAQEVLGLNPDGVFLSNGPGDPAALPNIVQQVQQLIRRKPMFGICLGHQIIGLALGGRTYKLKFGHHGSNQPVKELASGKVEITSQNHGFCVDTESLGDEVEVTHINLNDHTVEGLRHRRYPLFSVQYHPESSPGPHDSAYLFKQFVQLMAANK